MSEDAISVSSNSVWANKQALAVLLLAPSLFASNNVSARLAAGLIAPGVLAFARWGVTAAILIFLFRSSLWRKRAILRAEGVQLVTLGVLGMATASLATYEAAVTTTSVNIGFIFACAPAVILLLDRSLSRVPLSLWQICGLLCCMCGIVLIVGKGELLFRARLTFAPGDLIAVAGVFAWAVYSVFLKHWPSRLTTSERAGATATIGALVVLPVMVVESYSQQILKVTGESFVILSVISLASGLGVILAHAYLTRVVGPRRTVVLLYLVPIYNVALAWLIVGEVMDGVQVAGAVILLGGVYLAMRTPAADRPPTPMAGRSSGQSPSVNLQSRQSGGRPHGNRYKS